MAIENSGSLSKNDRKEQPNHPDIKGKCVIDGREYWISGWLKENDNGKWYSLSFQPKEEKRSASAPSKKTSATTDDDLPFAPIGQGLIGHAL
jgi:hypothetical protein